MQEKEQIDYNSLIKYYYPPVNNLFKYILLILFLILIQIFGSGEYHQKSSNYTPQFCKLNLTPGNLFDSSYELKKNSKNEKTLIISASHIAVLNNDFSKLVFTNSKDFFISEYNTTTTKILLQSLKLLNTYPFQKGRAPPLRSILS